MSYKDEGYGRGMYCSDCSDIEIFIDASLVREAGDKILEDADDEEYPGCVVLRLKAPEGAKIKVQGKDKQPDPDHYKYVLKTEKREGKDDKKQSGTDDKSTS